MQSGALGNVEQAHGPEGRPLQEAAGDDEPPPRRLAGDGVGVLEVGGEGLFDIDRLAGRQRRQSARLGVRVRGRGDGDHVDGVE